MAGLKFEIIEKLGILSEGSRGWKKEINLVSWNDRKAKADIRDWDENNEKMGKGITLTKEELKKLKKILDEIDIDELDMI
ncbi:MAG: hypothetical protein PWP46_891 [Fusobacteriaceae bacterium]|jgi:hypothetical protein|nr:hypothetical protein [Fusobacteriaceae bacterium]